MTSMQGNSLLAEPQVQFPYPPRVHRMLRPREVCERTTFSLSHIDRLQRRLCFPAFRPLAGRACGLPEHELDAFLAERMAAREGLAPLGIRPPLPEWHFCPSKVPAFCGIRLLRRREVAERTGLPKSTFYPLIALGLFPVQVPLGERAARWVAHEIDAWVIFQAAPASRGPLPGHADDALRSSS